MMNTLQLLASPVSRTYPADMGKPTLVYFDLRARAELPRLVAAVGGINYVDQRVKMSEWPGEYKSRTPYGQMPVLVVDGQWYAQRLAISLYFARKAGLYPTSGDPLKILKYDHALYLMNDIFEQILQARSENELCGKPEKLAALMQDLPKKIPFLEKILKENTTGFFVGKKLSVVDLSAYDVTEHAVDLLGPSCLESLPLLKAHFDRVRSHGSIRTYLSNRPRGEFNL